MTPTHLLYATFKYAVSASLPSSLLTVSYTHSAVYVSRLLLLMLLSIVLAARPEDLSCGSPAALARTNCHEVEENRRMREWLVWTGGTKTRTKSLRRDD